MMALRSSYKIGGLGTVTSDTTLGSTIRDRAIAEKESVRPVSAGSIVLIVDTIPSGPIVVVDGSIGWLFWEDVEPIIDLVKW